VSALIYNLHGAILAFPLTQASRWAGPKTSSVTNSVDPRSSQDAASCTATQELDRILWDPKRDQSIPTTPFCL
jgi:hypothetical protein